MEGHVAQATTIFPLGAERLFGKRTTHLLLRLKFLGQHTRTQCLQNYPICPGKKKDKIQSDTTIGGNFTNQ